MPPALDSMGELAQLMKFCPTCGDVYPAQATECRAHGTALRDWSDSAAVFPDGHTDVEVSRPVDPIFEVDADNGEFTAPEGSAAPALQPTGLTPAVQVAPEARFRPGEPHGGRILGERYRLDRQIGIGGYGAVFDAYDLRLRKRVAVKVLSPALSQDAEVLERFRREAIAASQVRHEGIVDVTDFDEDASGTHFIVMEYLGGIDLGDVLDAHGSLAPERALEIAAQCANALAAAHEAGIIHRDLKPANIFLTNSRSRAEIVKIIDFGISKITRKIGVGADLTSASKVLGTPAFMSPEQACGKELDGRTDVYALGIILFVMLTGKRPFTGKSALEILTKHLEEQRVPPSVVEPALEAYPALDALVLRAIAIKPSHRYESMEEFGATIRACLAGGAARPLTEAPAASDAVPEPTMVTPLARPREFASEDPTSELVTRRHPAAPSRARKVACAAAALAAVGLAVGAWLARRDDGAATRPDVSASRPAADRAPAAGEPEAAAVAMKRQPRDAAPPPADGAVGVAIAEDTPPQPQPKPAARKPRPPGRATTARKPKAKARPGPKPAPEKTVGIEDW